MFKVRHFAVKDSPLGEHRGAVLRLVKSPIALAAIETAVYEHRRGEHPSIVAREAERREITRLLKAARAFSRALQDGAALIRPAAYERLRAELEALAAGPDDHRTLDHRPRNKSRRRLAIAVAWALRDAGIRVSTAEDGPFARVLTLALDAAGDKPPVNLKPILIEVCREVKGNRARPIRYLSV